MYLDGVTYKEDRESVRDAVRKMVEKVSTQAHSSKIKILVLFRISLRFDFMFSSFIRIFIISINLYG